MSSGRLLTGLAIVWLSLLQPTWAASAPLPVFVLVGQSNMQGHAHVRTFDHVGFDPKTAPLLKAMRDADGSPHVCQKVWISSLSSGGEKLGRLTAGFGANEEKIGPEFTFGITLEKALGRPILLIKTAWGGKSLNTDFRSPSAGPYEFNASQLANFEKQKKNVEAIRAAKVEATGHYYRLTVNHVKAVLGNIKRVYPDYDAEAGYQLAGLVWFQGWNDMVDRGTYPQRDQPGGYDAYSETLAHWIRDIRQELSAPTLPVIIGVMGAGGPVNEYLPAQRRYAGIHQNFRSAMAAPASLPDLEDFVTAVFAEKYWDRELLELRAREATVRQRIRKLQNEQKLSRAEANQRQQAAIKEEFSAAELRVLRTGVSNQEYHYLGSAKIMAQIGKGFAEALIPYLPH